MRNLLLATLVFNLSLSSELAMAQMAGADTPTDTTTTVISPRQQMMMDLAQAQPESTDVLWLETNSESFLGLAEPAVAPEPLGAILILHHNGQHPDWPLIIHGMRTGLAAKGWDTLAIELPSLPLAEDQARTENQESTLANGDDNTAAAAETPTTSTPMAAPSEALQEQVFARITAALNNLQQKSPQTLTLLGVGTGAFWATSYLSANPPASNQRLTLVDVVLPKGHKLDVFAQQLAELPIGTIDLYHSSQLDKEPASQAAIDRKNASIRAKRSNYLQRRLPVRPGAPVLHNERLVKIWLGVNRKLTEMEQAAKMAAERAKRLQEQMPGKKNKKRM